MPAKPFSSLTAIITLATLACGLVSPASAPRTDTVGQETALTPLAGAASFTADQLKNAQYQLGTSDEHAVVQLTDGKYEHGSDVTTLDYARVTLTDSYAFGDLTGDGVNEAAAMVFENYGGTGDFGFLAIYSSVNGFPVFLTSTIIDDRPMINAVAIENGEVSLDAVVHGINDPGCCPALATTRRYLLVDNQLRLTNYTSATAGGAKRVIEITSPQNGTEVAGNLQLSGTVTVAPFENSLLYLISDQAGNQLAAGPLTVAATDPGGPGTFAESISLASIPAGTLFYLDIRDLSAADGATLALDTVKLLVK